jgi:hypothetical protein
MPREPRSFEPGLTYHLISRFIERRWFVTKPQERACYLELQGRALARTDWRLIGYAIMSNHIHLAAIAGRQALDSWLRPVHAPFADMLNEAHQRIGPVFVRGPKAYPVVTTRVGKLLAYIHNNPVRAGVCDAATDSTWTSHRAYVDAAKVPRWLHVSLGLTLAGVARHGFDEWVNDPLRRADTSFSEDAHELELQLAAEDAAGSLPKPANDEVADMIVRATAMAVGVSGAQIRGGSRSRTEVTARAAAVRCSMLLGLTEQAIARALNISQQRVSVLRRQTPSNDVRVLAAVVLDDVQATGGAK